MQLLNPVLLVIHVLAAFYWFGVAATLPTRIRQTLDGNAKNAPEVIKSLASRSTATGVSSLLVLATGVAMIFTRFGGMGGMPVRFHIGLTLTLIWFGIGVFLIRPRLSALAQLVRGSTLGPESDTLRKKIAMFTGIQHLLFFVTATLMLWRG